MFNIYYDLEKAKVVAQELLDNLNQEGMMFVIYPNGETEVTPQGAGYFPVAPLVKMDLSPWRWADVLEDYDMDNLSKADKDALLEYIILEITEHIETQKENLA